MGADFQSVSNFDQLCIDIISLFWAIVENTSLSLAASDVDGATAPYIATNDTTPTGAYIVTH
jgi:hypothetical protein